MLNWKTFLQKSPQQRFLLILGLVMFTFYLVLGVLLIIGNDILREFPSWARYTLGALLIVYAAIRFVRIINPSED